MKIRLGAGVISLVTGLGYFLLTSFSFFQSVSEANVYFKFWAVSIYIPASITILTYLSIGQVNPVWSKRLIATLIIAALVLWFMILSTSFGP